MYICNTLTPYIYNTNSMANINNFYDRYSFNFGKILNLLTKQ